MLEPRTAHLLDVEDELRKSIVFVMTTSDADEDIVTAYNLGVAGYILKLHPRAACAGVLGRVRSSRAESGRPY
jgi:DNA-binding NarL/FixJ family response regulator